MQNTSEEQSIAHKLALLKQQFSKGNMYDEDDSFTIFLRYVTISLNKAASVESNQIISQIKQR